MFKQQIANFIRTNLLRHQYYQHYEIYSCMEISDEKVFTNLLRMVDEVQDYAIILLDTDGKIVNWNTGAERIKGYSHKEIIGQSFSVFYTEQDQLNNKPFRLLDIAKREGRASDNGWRVRKDGSLFWGNITITAIHDEEKKVVGYGKLTRDLTENKKAEQLREFEAKNKELEQFAYIASHDLQEPLRTISNYIQLLNEDHSDNLNEEAKMFLKTIDKAAIRMTELVKGLLSYSRLGKSREAGPVDCGKMIRYAMHDLEKVIKDSRAQITVQEILPTVHGFAIEIRQLFQNLISNAIKFSKVGVKPVIDISCIHENEKCKFIVTDNGIGIEENNYEKIFTIFQRTLATKDYEGYGIGLANCKKIVESHGGNIWVVSELGKGSTFYFTL